MRALAIVLCLVTSLAFTALFVLAAAGPERERVSVGVR